MVLLSIEKMASNIATKRSKVNVSGRKHLSRRNVEELPEDDQLVLAGRGAEEVCSAERLLENRVGEERETDEREALVELLGERRGVGRGIGEALAEVRRGELLEAVDVADVGDGRLRRLEGEGDKLGDEGDEREEDGWGKRSSQKTSIVARSVSRGLFCSVRTPWKRPRANTLGTADSSKSRASSLGAVGLASGGVKSVELIYTS